MENNHQEKLNQIEAECREIKRQILQLEFQTKKDIAKHKKEMVEFKKEWDIRDRQIQLHLQHLSKLAGITFEELDAMDDRLTAAAVPLSRSRKR
jgi:multidrug resistance efflux pump